MNQADIHLRACPLCGSQSKKTLLVVENEWDVSECESCHFVFSAGVRKNSATEVEIPDDYEPIFRARHRQIYRLIKHLLPKGELIVDVGSGFGLLGSLVNEENLFRYVGFEPSHSVAAASERRGVSVRREIFDSNSLNERAGVVVLDNVIEHVNDPIQLLRECTESLREGGMLIVIVPNRWDLRRVIPSWRRNNHWIPPEHINYFTARNLSQALRELGLQARPFEFKALGLEDWRYFPRAALEMAGIYPFGLNFYGVKK